MAQLDLAAVRDRFPALHRIGPHDRPYVHTDAPGGTQVPRSVIDAMSRYLTSSNANTHGPFVTSQETDALCRRVRGQVASFVGGDPDGVVFGANMTTLTWHLSHALDTRLSPGDEIVCTRLDHDANVAPWLALAERTGATVRWIGLRADAALDLGNLDEVITDRTRLVCFPLASNAFGTVVDPAPLVTAAADVGALTFADAVHAAPHVPLDQQAFGVDVLACSPYKFFGPHSGILSADPALLASLSPDRVRPAPETGPEAWQTGTATFEAIAGIGAAAEYLADVGIDVVQSYETTLSAQFLDGLAGLRSVHLHGLDHPTDRTPTFALTVDGHTPAGVVDHLAADGIFAWAGHYYALEPMRALGLLEHGGAVRIGFVHYHGPDEVDRVLASLRQLG